MDEAQNSFLQLLGLSHFLGWTSREANRSSDLFRLDMFFGSTILENNSSDLFGAYLQSAGSPQCRFIVTPIKVKQGFKCWRSIIFEVVPCPTHFWARKLRREEF